MAIRNIHRNFNNTNTPTNIYRMIDGKMRQIKRVYRIIEGKPVIVWDLDSNEMIIEGYCSSYTSFKYTLNYLTFNDAKFSIPSTEDGINWTWEESRIMKHGFKGKVDWGDGTVESYDSDQTYTHSYNNNDYLNKNYNSTYSGVYFKIIITFDDDIDNIADSGFAMNSNTYSIITALMLPDSAKYITWALSLKNNYSVPCTLNVPSSMAIMTSYPAYNNIQSRVVIPDTVEYIGLDLYFCGKIPSYNNYYTSGVFQDCDTLTDITIPDSVKMIGTNCFHGCNTLANVTMGKGMEVFGHNCFNSCPVLQPFDLPSTTRYIMEQAFDYVATDLVTTNSDYNPNYDFLGSRDQYATQSISRNGVQIDAYIIPDGVLYVGYLAFNTTCWCRTISLPSSITHLGYDFFESNVGTIDVLYRGTVSQWFNIQFVNTEKNGYDNINAMLEDRAITDKYFYEKSTSIPRIVCSDGIIVNPYRYERTTYGDNCFDSDGKALRDKFLIL